MLAQHPKIARTADRDFRGSGTSSSPSRARIGGNLSSQAAPRDQRHRSRCSDRSKSSASSSFSSAESSASSQSRARSACCRQCDRPGAAPRQMSQHDHRGLGQPELRRRQDPTVARDQLSVICDEARHGPAELRQPIERRISLALKRSRTQPQKECEQSQV